MSKYHYTIDGMEFKSKKAVREYVKTNIHSQYPDHQPLSEDHFRFMVDLLKHHPWADQKFGEGIQKIWVAPETIYNTRCFWLERTDGSITDFSFYECLDGSTALKDFKMACRIAISEDILDFKKRFFETNTNSICPVLQTPLTPENCHVDHEFPSTFEQLVNDFIVLKEIKVDDSLLVPHVDGVIGNRLLCEEMEAKWIEYHRKSAQLRVISRQANMAL